MEKQILILATAGGFLDKFEKENVRILQRRGYTVHYAANLREKHYLFDESEIRDMGVVLHHVDIARSPFMKQNYDQVYPQLKEIVKKNHICAVHCHTPVGGVLGRLLGRHFKNRINVIYTAHGFHFYKGAPFVNNSIYYTVERYLAPYTDQLVVINAEDYLSAKRLHLREGGQVYRIPGTGLNRERFQPLSTEERVQYRRDLGIRDEEFFLVSVGELNANKNHIVVLQALQKLKLHKEKIPHIRYGICGDGFLAEELRKKVQEMGLSDIVTFYGYRTDVEKVLGCANASVFPSKREGLGMAGLESLAMGIPVIAADNRGTREYMHHKKNGYVCSAKDVDGFVRGIRWAYTLNEPRRQEIQSYCRKSTEPFDQSCADAIMEQVYQELDERLGFT